MDEEQIEMSARREGVILAAGGVGGRMDCLSGYSRGGYDATSPVDEGSETV